MYNNSLFCLLYSHPIWPGMPHFLSNKTGEKFVSLEILSVSSAASHFKDN